MLSKTMLFTAETEARYLATILLFVAAIIGHGGRSLESLSAVYPVEVNTMIMEA